MDKSEHLAEKYLRSLNQGTVIHEPDSNVPPDFLLGGRIAIEVRRLNQNFRMRSGNFEGLEEREIPLCQWLEKKLPELGRSIEGESWFVGIDFPDYALSSADFRSR